jgi:hypothetical protein
MIRNLKADETNTCISHSTSSLLYRGIMPCTI